MGECLNESFHGRVETIPKERRFVGREVGSRPEKAVYWYFKSFSKFSQRLGLKIDGAIFSNATVPLCDGCP